MVLQKMENAFAPGDPVLEIAARGKHSASTSSSAHDEAEGEHWFVRDEQKKLDAVVNGLGRGHYYLVIGEKGTGKTSMLIDAMHKIDGEGVSMFDAHADLEIFRVRLGKAVDYEFMEDNIGSLFSIRGPRDASALLDIERALNKLEKVALRRRKRVGKPLVLIINSLHLLRDDEDGRDLLELMQQRAEQWAVTGLATVVFNSDDYWVYERLKHYSTRMEVISVGDLPKEKAFIALREYRKKYFNDEPSEAVLEEVYSKIGGRLSFLNRVAKARDMMRSCDRLCHMEKIWFLNVGALLISIFRLDTDMLQKCWILGESMDDDVMDQQKFAVSRTHPSKNIDSIVFSRQFMRLL